MSAIEIRVNVGDSSYEVAKNTPDVRTYGVDRLTPAALATLDAAVRDMKAAMRAGDPS